MTGSHSLLVHLDYLGQTKMSYILKEDEQRSKYHILIQDPKKLHWFLQLVNVTHLNTIPLGRWSAPCNHHITLLLGLHLHKQTHLLDYNFRKHTHKTPLHIWLNIRIFLFLGSKYYQKHMFCKKNKTLHLKDVSRLRCWLAGDGLSLYSDWFRAYFSRVFIEQVSQQLVVTISSWVITVKPPGYTTW